MVQTVQKSLLPPSTSSLANLSWQGPLHAINRSDHPYCPRTLTHLFNLFILFPLVITVLTLPLSASAKPFWAVQVPVPQLFCWPHSGPGQHQVPRRPQNMVFSVIQATVPFPLAWNYLYATPVLLWDCETYLLSRAPFPTLPPLILPFLAATTYICMCACPILKETRSVLQVRAPSVLWTVSNSWHCLRALRHKLPGEEQGPPNA